MLRYLLQTLALLLVLATPAWGQAKFYKGTFTAPASTDAAFAVTGIVDDDGVTFQPDFVWIYGTTQTAEGLADNIFLLNGFSDCAVNGMSTTSTVEDAATTSDTYRASHNARFIDTYDVAGANTSRALVVSCGVGVVTLNFTVAGNSYLWHIVAIGGEDTSAKVLITSPGAVDETLDTSTFAANAGLHLATGSTSAGVEAVTAEAYNMGIGWFARQQALGTYQQGLINACSSDADATQVTGRWYSIRFTAASLTTSCGGTFISYAWHGNKGYVINNANDEDIITAYLGGEGLGVKGGRGAQPAAPGADTTTIASLPFTPKLICFFSTGQIAAAIETVQTEARYALGCATPDATGSIWVGDLQGAADTAAVRKFSTAEALSNCTPNATAASSTCEGVMTVSSWGDTGVTLTWSAADATLREYTWLAFGPLTPAGGTCRIRVNGVCV